MSKILKLIVTISLKELFESQEVSVAVIHSVLQLLVPIFIGGEWQLLDQVLVSTVHGSQLVASAEVVALTLVGTMAMLVRVYWATLVFAQVFTLVEHEVAIGVINLLSVLHFLIFK